MLGKRVLYPTSTKMLATWNGGCSIFCQISDAGAWLTWPLGAQTSPPKTHRYCRCATAWCALRGGGLRHRSCKELNASVEV